MAGSLSILATAPSFSLKKSIPPRDPADDLRKKDPMTLAKLFKSLERWPSLYWYTKIAFSVTLLTTRRDLIALSWLISAILIVAAGVVQDDGRFERSSVIVGSVGTLVHFSAVFVVFLLNRLMAIRRGVGPSLNGIPLSNLVRWLDLVEGEGLEIGKGPKFAQEPTADGTVQGTDETTVPDLLGYLPRESPNDGKQKPQIRPGP